MKENLTKIDFADRVRALAKLGLTYASDPHDKERYSELLELVSREYASVSGLDSEEVLRRFQKELGYVTPKVGVNGAVFDEKGCMLLEKRSDDGLWGVPGGWVEVGEDPAKAIERELREETNLNVSAKEIIQIFSRVPSQYNQPHSSCHILYHCVVESGEIVISHESLEVKLVDIDRITNWHRDHGLMARAAYAFWVKDK